MAQTQNTFSKGFNMDISDYVLPNNTLRNCQNMRIVSIEGMTFAAVNIPGNTLPEDAEHPNGSVFELSPHFIPVASKAYGGILYIVSLNKGDSFNPATLEVGTYPSPNYGGTDINTDIYKYRPINNLDGGPFSTDLIFDIPLTIADRQYFIDLELQFKYDNTINTIIVNKLNTPLLINTGFSFIKDKFNLVTTIDYISATLIEDTKLLLTPQEYPKIDLDDVIDAGVLKPGVYHYHFAYMDENFNETDIVISSKLCSVDFGYAEGGSELDTTSKAVQLVLTLVSTSYKFLRVYFEYNSGVDSAYRAVFRIDTPIAIDSDVVRFTHTGYELATEVSFDQINMTYNTVKSAATVCQVKGRLMLANITQYDYDIAELAAIAKRISITVAHSDQGWVDRMDASRVYHKLSEFGGETAAYGVVFLLKNGGKSPVFPITGFDSLGLSTSTDMADRGLIRFKQLRDDDILTPNTITIGLDFILDPIDHAYLELHTTGFFAVRGERVPDMLTQGYLIPTYRVPTSFTDPGSYGSSYDDNSVTPDNFKFVPALDMIADAYTYEDGNGGGTERWNVGTDSNNSILENGYMFITVCDNYIGKFTDDTGEGTGAGFKMTDAYHWAFYSPDALMNITEFITFLNRSDLSVVQEAKVYFATDEYDANQFKPHDASTGSDPVPNSSSVTNLRYTVYNHLNYSGYTPHEYTFPLTKLTYIPPEMDATIEGFGGKAHYKGRHALVNDSGHSDIDINNSKVYTVYQHFNHYFGAVVDGDMLDSGTGDTDVPRGCDSVSSTGGVSVGRNGHKNVGENKPDDIRNQVDGTMYNNSDAGVYVPAALLVSIYPRVTGIIDDPAVLYPSINNIVYRQVTDNIIWGYDGIGATFAVYGGDAYIGAVTHKLTLPGPNFRDKDLPDSSGQRKNINMGVLLDVKCQSKYNPAMRVPYQADVDELEERTCFPIRGNHTSVSDYRDYRYPETDKCTIGSDNTLGDKGMFAVFENTPYSRAEYMTRIVYSAREVQNAFTNNFRVFERNATKDYDTVVGAIVKIVELKDNIVVVFEHGVAIAPIEERTISGQDTAGSVFIEPVSVLPENLVFVSKTIGSQNPYSIVRTPSAVYGFDAETHKIWKLDSQFKIMSDDGFSTLLNKAKAAGTASTEVVAGYNLAFNEVYFTYVELDSDDNLNGQLNGWTLVYREGMERFTYFYSGTPYMYASIDSTFFTFGSTKLDNLSSVGEAYQQDNPNSTKLYNQPILNYLEFVINENPNMTKVIDSLRIISNEVAPTSIELYTYNKAVVKDLSPVDNTKTFQYIKLIQAIDPYTDEEVFRLKDRVYVVQVPTVQQMADDSSEEQWKSDSRLRNKAVIVRVSYDNIIDRVELLSIITNYRRSIS